MDTLTIVKLACFLLGTVCLVYVSRASLATPRSHGFYRFFAWVAILGTVAVRQPELVSAAIERFGAERIAVGLDARDGVVRTHGWQQTSHVTAVNLAREMAQRGVRTVIYTDISRDGMLSGVNVSATATLAMQTGLRVIASGGVASLDDIHELVQVASTGIEGVIIGKALYTGAVELEQAIAAAKETLC